MPGMQSSSSPLIYTYIYNENVYNISGYLFN